MKPLDVRDIAIIDAFPVYPGYPVFGSVLNVGCGEGRLDYHVANMGYKVYATDIEEREETIEMSPIPPPYKFYTSDIFDLFTFPIKSAHIVICSQVLEHLSEYKKALINLIELAEVRLIITIPFKKSFHSPTHCNFWDDYANSEFRCVREFINLCAPFSVAISKIITKPKDREKGARNYLITVDKRQNLTGD